MQSSTRANMEERCSYHEALAEYHRQRIEHAGGSGDSVAGAASDSAPAAEGESTPARGRAAPRVVPRDPSVTVSRDQTLYALHDDVAKQIRAALETWQDAPSLDAVRSDMPVARSTTSAMARSAAARRTRH